VKIRPVHHAVLCYLEWHCDRRIPFRTQKRMADDLARNETEIMRATRDLVTWGLVSFRHDESNHWHIVRLGDGRETPPVAKSRCPVSPMKIPAVHKRRGEVRGDIWKAALMRIAA